MYLHRFAYVFTQAPFGLQLTDVEVLTRQDVGIWIWLPQYVECELRLWQEQVPEVMGEDIRDFHQDYQEVRFECVNGFLPCVPSGHVGGDKLVS